MSDFEDWMRKEGFSKSTILKYDGAISGAITKWATENSIIPGSLADIADLSKFQSVAKRIKELPIFKRETPLVTRIQCRALEVRGIPSRVTRK